MKTIVCVARRHPSLDSQDSAVRYYLPEPLQSETRAGHVEDILGLTVGRLFWAEPLEIGL